MSIVTLAEAKEHLRITHSDEDIVLQNYMDAADRYIENFLNRKQVQVNAAIKSAALLIVGGLFENREWHSEKDYKENPAVSNLLYPYRADIGF